MVKYINASQVGNILYFDTKTQDRGGYYLDTHHPTQILKTFKKYFLSYKQKYVLTKLAINVNKILTV